VQKRSEVKIFNFSIKLNEFDLGGKILPLFPYNEDINILNLDNPTSIISSDSKF